PYNPKGFARIGSPATEFAIRAAEENNLSLIRMLPGGVYGAGSWFKESVYRLVKRGWFRVFGDGQNVLSYVHVDDVAEAYRLAAERLPVGEAIALVDDEPTKTVDFANFVAEQMGRPPVKSLPKWVGAMVAGGVVAEALTMNCKVRNRKAKELLGWRPKYPTYREGIPAAIAEIERS
ncbi:MAG: NAD-dependent epimerase/dehydratase family protein, partial [bacterium]